LLAKVQKSLSDHTGFIKEKQDLEEWLNRAEGTLQDCSGFGNEASTKEKLETVQMVSTRMTEGQHLLAVLQDSFARVVGVVPPEQQDTMRSDLSTLRSRCEKLNMDVKNSLTDLKDACQRWEDFRDNCKRFDRWCDSTEEILLDKPSTRAELGDMKTLLERYKNLDSDIIAQKLELNNLEGEASQLSLWSGSDSVTATVSKLRERWSKLDAEVKALLVKLEQEIGEYSDYHNALQETEKWLLQTSFQLMAHNSLYITNREQTLEQVAIHEGLLEEIQVYQSTLDDVKSKGHLQINRYISTIPKIETTISKQLKNVQDSYESLLHTGLQIKKRLIESLAKFQEYEDTLESIMQNLDKWEPEIFQTLESPIESFDASSKRLEYIRVSPRHSKF
jgi:nesprin-1